MVLVSAGETLLLLTLPYLVWMTGTLQLRRGGCGDIKDSVLIEQSSPTVMGVPRSKVLVQLCICVCVCVCVYKYVCVCVFAWSGVCILDLNAASKRPPVQGLSPWVVCEHRR